MKLLDNSIEYEEGLYQLRSSNEALHFAPGSPEYFQWLASLKSFRFVGLYGSFTARLERITESTTKTTRGLYWYAHRNFHNEKVKRYLGKTSSMFSIAFLEESAKLIEEALKKKLGLAEDEILPASTRNRAGREALQERIDAQEETIADLHGQVETLLARVVELEGQLQIYRDRHEKRVRPKQDEAPPAGFIWLRDFCALHYISYGEAERLFHTGFLRGQKISLSRGRASIAIGQKGQHDFYIMLKAQEGFRTCDDCPHVE